VHQVRNQYIVKLHSCLLYLPTRDYHLCPGLKHKLGGHIFKDELEVEKLETGKGRLSTGNITARPTILYMPEL
jgi:hypothetical protein